MPPQLSMDRFEKFDFQFELADRSKISHDVYHCGDGPPVLIIQELPGIGTETLSLAQRITDEGYTVYLPHLFGPIKPVSKLGTLTNLARVFCMRKEFKLLATNKSSPVVEWLKALCRKIKTDTGASGVGAIGMCLTGNFAISLMADDSVIAAVSSQPSLPLNKQDEIHMSDDEIQAVRQNIDATAPIKAYRFDQDSFCTAQKFDALERAFNNDKIRIEMQVLPSEKNEDHSVLTRDFVDREGHPTHAALQEIFAYFSDQLKSQ